MKEESADIGTVGIGTMGRNLLLNMVDHGYKVAGYDRDPDKPKALVDAAGTDKAFGTTDYEAFVKSIRKPRAVMMLVPAGKAVDQVIEGLLPLLEPGDLLIDGGNSHFKDTDRRIGTLAKRGLAFFGMGVSGGESGARHGPSMMPGGPREAYERVRPILEDVAAKVKGEPCVRWLGSGSAGHYVKMVHNGIEYGIMQLISETYHLMKVGMGLDNDAIQGAFGEWRRGELGGYLMEITADIFEKKDDRTGNLLVDMIRDVARQKGTGQWTSQDAFEMHVPVPCIDSAVMMRNLSGREEDRKGTKKTAPIPAGVSKDLLPALKNALHFGVIITYAQGMSQLRSASKAYGYGLTLSDVARIWRGGCIIRSVFLEEITRAFTERPDLPNLIQDPEVAAKVRETAGHVRTVLAPAVELGIPAPTHAMALAYYDALRSPWLPVNLIQAQRDCFGAHTYERVDAEGTFHTPWSGN